VEHLLAKEGVAGSIPVSRFFDAKNQDILSWFFCVKKVQPRARRFDLSAAGVQPRSVLLLCRVIHWMTAPSRAFGKEIKQ